MISAETLKTLVSFTPVALSKGLEMSGYSGQSFKNAEFLGITNGGQFCYKVTYYDESGLGETTDKVFLTYNHQMGSVKVDY